MNVLSTVLLVLQSLEAALKAVELVLRKDINGDGVVGFGPEVKKDGN